MTFAGQVLHVFRNDLRRFWPALVGVAALMAIHRTVGLPVPGGYVRPFEGQIPVFPLLLAALTVLVVQGQRVSGDRTFWATRPVGGPAILGAKALFIGLFFCLLPVTVHVQWLQALAGGGDTSALFANSVLYQGAFLAVVAAGAAVTPNLPTFAALAIPVWLGTELLASMADPGPFGALERPMPGEVELAHRWLWLVTGATALVHQYWTRRTMRTLVVGLSTLLVATPAIERAQPRLASGYDEPPERFTYPKADEVRLRLASISHGINTLPDLTQRSVVVAHVTADAGPPVWLRVSRSETSIEGPDVHYQLEDERVGRTLEVGHSRMPIDDIMPADASGPLRPNSLSILVAEDAPDDLRGLSRAERIQIDIDVDVYGKTAVRSIPLEAGESFPVEAGTVTLERVVRSPGVLQAHSQLRMAVAAMNVRAAYRDLGLANSSVYNPRYGTHVFGRRGGGSSAEIDDRLAPEHYLVGGSWLEERGGTAVSLGSTRRGTTLPDDWLEDAVLLQTEPVYLGSFTRTLETPLDSFPGPNERLRIPARQPAGGGEARRSPRP